MTTYASFKPSVQFLEAGEKAQQFANAANTFKPLLSQEARQSIEGVDKVAQAFTATGRALEHFGFDEAEPESTPFQQLQFAPHSMIEELPSVPALPLDDPEMQKIIEHLGNIEKVPELTPSKYIFQHIKQAGFDDPITASGQAIDTDAFTISDSAANDPLTGGGQMMDTDDDLGAWFALPAVTGLFKGSLAAGATKVMGAAKGVIAGAKAVTAKQVGGALVTGAVSGVASYGASSAMERYSHLLSEADDRDSDYGTPWVPEVAVDPIA